MASAIYETIYGNLDCRQSASQVRLYNDRSPLHKRPSDAPMIPESQLYPKDSSWASRVTLLEQAYQMPDLLAVSLLPTNPTITQTWYQRKRMEKTFDSSVVRQDSAKQWTSLQNGSLETSEQYQGFFAPYLEYTSPVKPHLRLNALPEHIHRIPLSLESDLSQFEKIQSILTAFLHDPHSQQLGLTFQNETLQYFLFEKTSLSPTPLNLSPQASLEVSYLAGFQILSGVRQSENTDTGIYVKSDVQLNGIIRPAGENLPSIQKVAPNRLSEARGSLFQEALNSPHIFSVSIVPSNPNKPQAWYLKKSLQESSNLPLLSEKVCQKCLTVRPNQFFPNTTRQTFKGFIAPYPKYESADFPPHVRDTSKVTSLSSEMDIAEFTKDLDCKSLERILSFFFHDADAQELGVVTLHPEPVFRIFRKNSSQYKM